MLLNLLYVRNSSLWYKFTELTQMVQTETTELLNLERMLVTTKACWVRHLWDVLDKTVLKTPQLPL